MRLPLHGEQPHADIKAQRFPSPRSLQTACLSGALLLAGGLVANPTPLAMTDNATAARDEPGRASPEIVSIQITGKAGKKSSMRRR